MHGRLVEAGINPLDPKVQAISEVVNAFYAEKTHAVLQKMQDVLSKIEDDVRSQFDGSMGPRCDLCLVRSRSAPAGGAGEALAWLCVS